MSAQLSDQGTFVCFVVHSVCQVDVIAYSPVLHAFKQNIILLLLLNLMLHGRRNTHIFFNQSISYAHIFTRTHASHYFCIII